MLTARIEGLVVGGRDHSRVSVSGASGTSKERGGGVEWACLWGIRYVKGEGGGMGVERGR